MEKILAPIPGKILSIDVKQGQNVKGGQVVLILEAMKMENEIYCNESGIVKEILVAEGALVQANQPLMVIE